MTPIVLAVHFPAKQLSKLRMAAMRLGARRSAWWKNGSISTPSAH